MHNMKKLIALGLAATMTLSLAACGGKTKKEVVNNDIGVATWWTNMTFSSGQSIDESVDWQNAQLKGDETDAQKEEKLFNQNVAQLKFDTLHKVEEKYGITFHYDNITITGVKESINTSILAGTPDYDIYLVEPSMAIPAQFNGLALDLKTVLPEDADIFTDQKIMTYLDMGDGKVCIIKRVEAQGAVEATYPLGFNMQMLADNNLEDPRDLWERGEWTWDKFIEYCQVLTQDTDGDGQIDQYGFGGYSVDTLTQLLMSNNTTIAGGTTETLSSAATGEALQMLYDMFNTYKVCYPYDYDYNGDAASETNRRYYRQGKIGFFPIAAWIASDGYDYDFGGEKGVTLPFDTAYVRWPVGPSGDKDLNPGKLQTSGEFYIIPVGVAEPEKVYNVLYDIWNWFDGDTSIRDDRKTLNWWYGVTASSPELQDQNFAVMFDCGSHVGFDLWETQVNVIDNMGTDLEHIVDGTMTPAQFQETYKQAVQAELDAMYK